MSKQRHPLTIKHERQQRDSGRIMAVNAHSQRPDYTRQSKADLRALASQAYAQVGEYGVIKGAKAKAMHGTAKPPKGGFHWRNGK